MTEDTKSQFNVTPSQNLRKKRPELYSDSNKVQQYKISKDNLDFQLCTLTERNQHKDFEDYCRGVAQREICRNIRPQTGPEGGGDGKVDAETYPVSDEVALTWYVGLANSNKERWAFAFSAQKNWKDKVKSDFKKIVSTDRGYYQIHFFTNQNPKQKERLEVQDQLTDEYGIPLTIYERNWLVDRTLTNDHSDLANEHLRIGEYNPRIRD